MRQRWERMLNNAETEAEKMKESGGVGGDATATMSRTYSSERYGTAADMQAPPAGAMGDEEAGRMGGAMGESARPRGAGGTGAGAGPETERPMPPNEP
jgi:hypothetical protein